MNAVLDVSVAIDSRDCVFPGCDREAERDGRCRWHIGRTPHVPAGPLKPGALAHLMHDDEPQPEPVKETPVITCKIDGCENRPLDQRGPYAGLCAGHKTEKRDQRASERAQAPAAAPSQTTPPAPPEPPAVEAAPETPEAAPGTLTQLAIAVDAAQAALDEAIVRHADALQALSDALEAA